MIRPFSCGFPNSICARMEENMLFFTAVEIQMSWTVQITRTCVSDFGLPFNLGAKVRPGCKRDSFSPLVSHLSLSKIIFSFSFHIYMFIYKYILYIYIFLLSIYFSLSISFDVFSSHLFLSLPISLSIFSVLSASLFLSLPIFIYLSISISLSI